jgi:hypothetical protein
MKNIDPIDHSPLCWVDHLLYGNCFHRPDGQRIPPMSVDISDTDG